MRDLKQTLVLTQPLLGQIREELRNEPPGMVDTPKLTRRLISEALAARKAKRTVQALAASLEGERLEVLTTSLSDVGQ